MGGTDSKSEHLKVAGHGRHGQPSRLVPTPAGPTAGSGPSTTGPGPRGALTGGGLHVAQPLTPPPTHVANGLIAYDADGIFVVKPDGTGRRQLDTAGSAPVFSPDGSRLAYVRSDIWVVNADGSGRHALNGGGGAFAPTWSPDGRRIAYAVSGSTSTDIWVVGVDGGQPKRLTSNASAGQPEWSPDGARIAFSDGGRIKVMNRDGSGAVAVSPVDQLSSGPRWSPNGSLIAFMQTSLAPASESITSLAVVRPDGEGLKTLSPSSAWPPVWSPNGDGILFSRSGFTLIHPDGSGRQSVPSAFGDTAVDWSPDGGQIPFIRSQNVWVMKSNGSNQNQIASGSGSTVPQPDWSG